MNEREMIHMRNGKPRRIYWNFFHLSSSKIFLFRFVRNRNPLQNKITKKKKCVFWWTKMFLTRFSLYCCALKQNHRLKLHAKMERTTKRYEGEGEGERNARKTIMFQGFKIKPGKFMFNFAQRYTKNVSPKWIFTPWHSISFRWELYGSTFISHFHSIPFALHIVASPENNLREVWDAYVTVDSWWECELCKCE